MELVEILKGKHETYCKEVSLYYMAASYQVCKYIVELFDGLNIKSYLDLGSGISTYTAYLYKNLKNKDLDIWSVDTDIEFLNKTKQFILKDYHIDENQFIMWDQLSILKDKQFDLIFYDISGTRERLTMFYEVSKLNLIGEETYILFDDVNKFTPPKDAFLYKFKSYEIIPLREKTLDDLGRWSSIYYKFRNK